MNSQGLIYVMLGFFVIYALVYLLGWRCPKCKKHLGKLVVQRCKHCGHHIWE
ncbi:MAG: hypothetical protein IJ339_02340 [Oscillospiraceae bacterium]|nr:hypothetical protein [Oscillospiraceae bacterium]